MQHRFSCMFDGCEEAFCTLREFKKHITEDHKEDEQDEFESLSPETPTSSKEEDKQQSTSDNDDESTADSGEIESDDDNGQQPEDDDYDINSNQSRKCLDDKEKSALNGLLMLCENKPTPKRSQSFPNSSLIPLQTVNNIPVIPSLSPKSPKTPKSSNRKYPTAAPIIMAENESSAKFYCQSPKISNLTTQLIKKKQHNAKTIGKKRKLSEMDADELAHLCLKLQDKISAMDQTMKTTQKQLMVVRNLYRKKARLSKH